MIRSALFLAPWLCAVALVCSVSPPADAQKNKKKGARHEQMDYGPFLTATVTAPTPAKNTANKGLAIRLGAKQEAAVCFDMDLCRYSCGWTGDFLNLRGTPFDGGHGSHPTVKGKPAFATRPTPGWAKPGTYDFADPRTEPYGPLAHSNAR